MRNKRGFTLVELLVVIAIIALLMSVLMPALSRVKSQAKNAGCQMKLKQWGNIFAMYTNDWDGSFMKGYVGAGKTKPIDQWTNALRPYHMDNKELMCCPSAMKPRSEIDTYSSWNMDGTFLAWGVFPSDSAATGLSAGDYGSYGMNVFCCNPYGPCLDGLPLSTSILTTLRRSSWMTTNVENAGEIPVFCDSSWVDFTPSNEKEPPSVPGTSPLASLEWPRVCLDRHNGGINVLFMDWSVRWVSLKQLWKLKWSRNADTTLAYEDMLWWSGNGWPDWMKNCKE